MKEEAIQSPAFKVILRLCVHSHSVNFYTFTLNFEFPFPRIIPSDAAAQEIFASKRGEQCSEYLFISNVTNALSRLTPSQWFNCASGLSDRTQK